MTRPFPDLDLDLEWDLEWDLELDNLFMDSIDLNLINVRLGIRTK